LPNPYSYSTPPRNDLRMLLLRLSLAGLALSVWAPGGLTLAVPSWLLSAPLWVGVLLLLLLRCLYHPSVPAVRIALEPSEACDMPPRVAPPSAKELADPVRKQSTVDCWDPATGHYLGAERVCSPDEVKERVRRARAAQQEWAKSSFDQRRQLLRILSRCTLEHADAICRVSARDSGKPMPGSGVDRAALAAPQLGPLSEAVLRLPPPGRAKITRSAPLHAQAGCGHGRADHDTREERLAHQRG
jgi:hypothetical protein